MSTWHRSWLFVPADDERKIDRARRSGADALILDLEDSVVPGRRPAARRLVAELADDLSSEDPDLWVRVNAVDSVDSLDDLAAVVHPRLAGVVLPKFGAGRDVVMLGHHLDALEVRSGTPRGSVSIMAVATETPRALFHLGELAEAGPRLEAVTWGAEDLATAVGAVTNKDGDGHWSAPFELARSLALHAAGAAGAQAVDTLHAAFRDEDGLGRSAARAASDGFTGKLAIHPGQVDAINAAFTVAPQAVEHATQVIDAFAAAPSAGVVAIDGRMYDRPHLVQAEKLVERARRTTQASQDRK